MTYFSQHKGFSFKPKTIGLKLLLLFLICTANFQLASAQRFPVQVNQSLIPPYNTKLNSYATSTDVKLRLFLTLTDVNVSNRQVRLKLKIQGKGLNIQSADFVTGASPIFLNGGTQQQFTNIDLAPYFQLNNLLGITPQQYNQPLPDGSYKICWEVYDALTNQLISNTNTGCSNIFLLLNDPPFLNLPNRGDQLTDIQPTNIVFQWTPRHANATNVSYEFEIRELWDKQIDPQAAFLASPPFHTETSFSTTLLYNIGKPTLIPGRTYGWRVRAKSTTGLSENSVFRNNGYSEIFYFTFTNQCFPPTFALAEPLDKGRVKIIWQTHPDHNKYHVQYKRADVADAEWFEVFSYNNQVQIANLQDGVTYNFRVGGTCHALTDFEQGFSYSAVNQFTMPTADESLSYSCGIVPEITITNTNPLDNIGVNETFTAGDFPVTIKQIEGGNGNYSGTGFIVVPYLADTKIAVEFNNININTDYQLYDGIIRTTYDPTWSGVESVDGFVDDVEDIIANVFTTNDDDDTSDTSIDQDNNTNSDSSTDDSINEDTNDNSNNTDTNTSDFHSSDNNNSSATDDNSNNSDSTNTASNTSSSNNDSSNTGDTEVVIVHGNKSYKDGDVIEVDYHREKPHFAFLLKNHPKNATFNWQVLKLGTDNTSAYVTNETIHDNLGIDMKQIHILDVVANYNNKKTQVTIKRKTKEFKLEELYALHNEKRLAKSGQILYLVNPSSVTNTNKKVKYGLKLDKSLNEDLISPNAIQWSFNGENQYFSTAKTNITRDLEESDNTITTSVNAGNPNSLEKSVDVEWVDGYYKEVDVVSPAVQNALNELSDYVNKLGSVLEKLDNSGELEFNISFHGEEYLEEDSNSRFYNIVRKGGFGGSIDLEFNGFSYGWDLKVVTAEIGLKPILSVSGNGTMGYIRRNDKDSFTETGIEMSFRLNADLQVVGTVGFDLLVVKVKAEPYAGISSWGEVSYSNKTKSIEGSFGVGKPYVGIVGEVLVADYNIIPTGNLRYTWEEVKLELPFEYNLKE